MPAQNTVSNSVEAGAFSVPQGALSVALLNTGAAAVTFDGIAIPAGQAINYPFIANRYYPTITGDASGSSALLTIIR